MSDLPILYSFRRCPYAIRARYVLALLNISVELREVELKNKPAALLKLGGRTSVPQLIDVDGTRYEESIDIVGWALSNSHKQSITESEFYRQFTPTNNSDQIKAWLFQNDFRFKPWLDKYKYADRHPEFTCIYYRSQAEAFLRRVEAALKESSYLLGPSLTLADVLVFPFIRQFRGVDVAWFDASQYVKTQEWLNNILASPTFNKVMQKYSPWQEEQKQQVIF